MRNKNIFSDKEFEATINKEPKNGFSDLENSKLNFLISFSLCTKMYYDVLIEKLNKYKNSVYLEKLSKQTGGNK